MFSMESHLTLQLNAQKTEDGWAWCFKRNCSISPTQLATIFALLGFLSVAISLAFYTLGATLILPYSFIEITALALAFAFTVKHASDYEKLEVGPLHLTFEYQDGFSKNKLQMNRALTRVEVLKTEGHLIKFSQGKESVLFGQHVHAHFREKLTRQILSKI